MTLTREEAEKVAEELVQVALEQKQLSDKMKTLKAQLLEFADVENINDTSWGVDNGYVEIKTETKYKLAEIPAVVDIDANVCARDVAEKAFTSKIVLSKEGKQMFNEQYPSIVKLMVGTPKKIVKVTV